MAYMLVKPEVLRDKGYNYFETMPDGRAIAETNIMKVLGSIKEVEIVSTTKELEELIKKQKEEILAKELEQEKQKAEQATEETPSVAAEKEASKEIPSKKEKPQDNKQVKMK